jgi:MFS transporter, DHA1 family, multidrug resistance protein
LCVAGVPETLPSGMRRDGGIPASFTAMGVLLRQKAFMCYVGVQGFTMGGFFGYVAASPFVLQGMYGISPQGYSVIFGSNALSVMLVALLTGKLSRRFGEARLLALGNTLRGVACLGVLVATLLAPASPVPLLVTLFFMLALQGMTLPTSFTLGISAQNVGAGTASGILGVAVFIFGAGFSPLVGLAGADTAVPLGLVCAFSGVAAVVLGHAGNRNLARLRAANKA